MYYNRLYLFYPIFVLTLILMSIGLVFDYLLLVATIGAIVFVVGIVQFTKNPLPVLLLLIVIRPALGAFSEYRIAGFFGIQMFTSITLLIATIKYLLNRRYLGNFLNNPISILLTLYTIINISSFLFNPRVNPGGSLSFIFRIMTFLFLFFLGQNVFASTQKRILLLYAVLISCFIPNSFAIFQLVTGTGHDGRGVIGAYGTFAHPNMYANYLILVSIVNLYFILEKRHVNLNYIFLTLNTLLLLNTYGRAALITLCFVFVVVCFIKKRTLLIYLALISVFIYVGFHDIFEGYIYRFSSQDSNSMLSGRTVIWKYIYLLFKENPVLGIGPGTFYPYYYNYAPHNEFLRNLAEGGIIGTSVYVCLWSIILAKSSKMLSKDFTNSHFLIFLLITSFLFLSLTSNLANNAEIQWPFWLLLGATFSTYDEIGNCKTEYNNSGALNIE